MDDHDQRFKTLMQEFFVEFLQLFFPAWVERFDFSALEWLSQEIYPDPPEGRRYRIDLVARLKVRLAVSPHQAAEAGRWLVLVHVEIEAADKVAPLHRRMFRYYNYLEDKHGLPVLPIGLYLRVGLDGIGWAVYEEWFWEHRIVHYEYAYVGLPALDGLHYVQGANCLGVALAVLMRVPEEKKAWLRAEAEQRLATCPENEWRQFLLRECVEAYLPLEGAQLDEYQRLLQTEQYQEARIMAMTTYEKGMAQGVAQGMAQGIAQGVTQGVAQGQRVLLERQLERKFGPLPGGVREQLASWPPERLTELGDALLTAQSLQELGLAGPAHP